jgi:hypothetical protein
MVAALARAVRQMETAHNRFTRWAKAGVWEMVFDSPLRQSR